MTNNKRMLMVFPYMGHGCTPVLPPLSACFLSTSAKNAGWKLDFLDGQLYEHKLLLRIIKDKINKYSAFGLSVYSGYVEQAILIAKLIRQMSSAPIVWGGVHPTLYPEQLVNHDLADFVVSGYGEVPLELLLKRDFKHKDRILYGNIEPTLASHPPDYSVFDMELYNKRNSKRVASLITSRGCKYNCRFCINSIQKQNVAFIDTEIVEASVSDLVLNYGIDELIILDEHFYKDNERLSWFCNLMSKYSISWEANFRSDIVARFDTNIMQMISRSKCKRINMGMESASDRILKLLGKGIKVSDYLTAVNMCMKYGIPMSASFMIDLPTESAEEKTATMTMARLLRNIGVVVFGPMRYRPMPGTAITDHMIHASPLDFPTTLEGWVNSSFSMKFKSNDWENVDW